MHAHTQPGLPEFVGQQSPHLTRPPIGMSGRLL
jgi:hypothetical protein